MTPSRPWRTSRVRGPLPDKPFDVLRRLTAFCLLFPVFALPCSAFEVPFSVTEPSGVDRPGASISGGLPLPEGRFQQGTSFSVYRRDGTPVPAQISPLVVRTDGTLRWILVDFQDDLEANDTNHYVLRDAPSNVSPDPPLRVRRTDRAITVNTGSISFTIRKEEPFSLFDQVETHGNPVISGGSLVYEQPHPPENSDQSSFSTRPRTAGPPDRIRVWYEGPLRVTIEVSGSYRGGPPAAGYTTWITARAGSSRVRVKHKLRNSNPDRYTRLPVRRQAIQLQLAKTGGRTLLGAGRPVSVDEKHSVARLRTSSLQHARAGTDETTLWNGSDNEHQIEGWLSTGGPRPVFVCDRQMPMDPPRRLAVENGTLLLEGTAPIGGGDRPFPTSHRWLFDSSHHRSTYLLDFDPPEDPAPLSALSKRTRSRLWLRASPAYYRRTRAAGTGAFGTLTDEKTAYRNWGWSFRDEQVPRREHDPRAYVRWENNHGESEADSPQAMLMMYLRTGNRGWFDHGRAWARYHMDLQAWRTDGWSWKDGAIWFPTGGPQGNRRVRAKKWNMDLSFLPDDRRKRLNRHLKHRSKAKACRCHFYGSGVATFYCLTGDRDAFDTVIDLVEVKDDEMRHYMGAEPGETSPGSIRAFGRGFQVVMRALMIDPGNEMIRDLADLYADVLWHAPKLDERGFLFTSYGAATGSIEDWKQEIEKRNLKIETEKSWRFDPKKIVRVTERDTDRSWRPKYMGGTWQHVYVQNGADMYARYFDDENMRDFTIGFAQMSRRFMLSDHCHQTWYQTAFDVVEYGTVHDPWAQQHRAHEDGEDHKHSGWYTRFYPDACAKGYTWTGHAPLLEKARTFWFYGSRRSYRSKHLSAGPDEVGRFATHNPPKQDSVLSTARLFYHTAHPRDDRRSPEPVSDLEVEVDGNRATVSFTAPADRGGGRVEQYQVKCASLPIRSYGKWQYARDHEKKRNWWRAANVEGEPEPGRPGSRETFTVTGVPGDARYFTVRSRDGSWNLSPIGEVAEK